eukprot:764472-Hanusia_phi.AAC.2
MPRHQQRPDDALKEGRQLLVNLRVPAQPLDPVRKPPDKRPVLPPRRPPSSPVGVLGAEGDMG